MDRLHGIKNDPWQIWEVSHLSILQLTTDCFFCSKLNLGNKKKILFHVASSHKHKLIHKKITIFSFCATYYSVLRLYSVRVQLFYLTLCIFSLEWETEPQYFTSFHQIASVVADQRMFTWVLFKVVGVQIQHRINKREDKVANIFKTYYSFFMSLLFFSKEPANRSNPECKVSCHFFSFFFLRLDGVQSFLLRNFASVYQKKVVPVDIPGFYRCLSFRLIFLPATPQQSISSHVSPPIILSLILQLLTSLFFPVLSLKILHL